MKATPERSPDSDRPPSRTPHAHQDAPSPTSLTESRPPRRPQALTPGGVRHLQGAAGNAAVSRLVAQRYASTVKPPPAQAPGFRRVKQDVAAKKQKIAAHRPAETESRSAQDAAVAPPDDKEAQGKAANAEKMNAAKPGEFNKAAFIAAVNAAIAKQAPKNLEEADDFAGSGKADAVKGEVSGKVKDGKQSSAKAIETTTEAPPDTSQAKDKKVVPMGPDTPPGNPGAPSAADAVPARQPDAVLDFSEGNKEIDQKLADSDVTEEQLAKSNEPQFTGALSEKKKAEAHTAAAPAKGRAAESGHLSEAKAGAAAAGVQAMTAMTADRAAAGKAVDGGKGETKSADERKRQEVTAKLQKVFDATQKDVKKILDDLDGKVDRQFTDGEKKARDAFTADHERRMKAYKDKRYSGFTGKMRWVRDKFKGLPQEGLNIFQESRKLYVTQMQAVISSVADTIGGELGRAKTRIAAGRAELKAEVDRLPADLKKFGQDAAKDFAGKFDDLESSVNDKSQELVQTLASKYTEALNAVDEEIKKLQDENKGLIAKVKDAVVGAIQTILELKNLLMGVLAKAAGAVMKIIKDPIGFLRNLVTAVGAGLQQFLSNIGTHLQKGLVSWLLGTATKAGLEVPAKFDRKGVIGLLSSLLGLTWSAIRAKIVRKGVPEQAMSGVEQSVPVAAALAKEGPAGAVNEISAEVGDLKTRILDDLKSYLIPTVIIAGITWIVSLLTPASAFIRAVKGIIDIVTFIVTQGAQIMEFVNSVLDAVIAIANGGQAGVPRMIETALAASIPLLIGFLAALVGVGGLAGKIRSVFQKAARPVHRVIDKLIDKIAAAGKAIWNNPKDKAGAGDNSPQGKQRRLDQAMAAAKSTAERFSGRPVGKRVLNALFPAIRRRYGLTSLRAVESGENWEIQGVINPTAAEMTKAQVVGVMKWYKSKHSAGTFDAAEKAELDQLIKDTNDGKLTKEEGLHKYNGLINRAKARREDYVAAETSPEKPHSVSDKSGKEMVAIESRRAALQTQRAKDNIERRRLAKKLGFDNPDKVTDTVLDEQRLLGNTDADDFQRVDRKYKSDGTLLTRESEKLGMVAARDFAQSKGAEPFYEGPPGAAGTLDLVMLKAGQPPSLLICEAKGGDSELRTRAIGGIAYQQGRPEYLKWMCDNDKAFRAKAEQHGLLKAIDEGKLQMEYHLVKAPGGQEVLVQQFSLNPSS